MHIRPFLLLTLALAVAALLQSTLGNSLALFTARPDLVLTLVVTFAVVRGMEEGLLAGILGGLLVGFLSAVPFGATLVGMGLVGLVTGLGESNIYRSNLVIPLVAVFVATVVYHSILMLTLQAAGWNVAWISTLALQTVPGALLNAVLAPLAFPLVRKLAAVGAEEERLWW